MQIATSSFENLSRLSDKKIQSKRQRIGYLDLWRGDEVTLPWTDFFIYLFVFERKSLDVQERAIHALV
jgi:hypothetical protein